MGARRDRNLDIFFYVTGAFRFRFFGRRKCSGLAGLAHPPRPGFAGTPTGEAGMDPS